MEADPPTSEGPAPDPSVNAQLHRFLDRTVAFVALLSAAACIRDTARNVLDLRRVGPEDDIGCLSWEAPRWSHVRAVAERVEVAVRSVHTDRSSCSDAVARIAGDGRAGGRS